MWISSILIIVATLAGLLSLWRDEIVADKILAKPGETDDQKNERLEKLLKAEKTKRLKTISSIFIFLTLVFTIYQIRSSYNDSILAAAEKQIQHTVDSTRFINDSLSYISQRKSDSLEYAKIDSIRMIQIKAFESQILAGKTIDDIKIKSASLMKNLSVVNAEVVKNSAMANKSFNELSIASARLLYPLEDNIVMDLTIYFWSSKIEKNISNYLKTINNNRKYIKIDETFAHYKDIQELLKDAELNIKIFNVAEKAQMYAEGPPKRFMFDYMGSRTMMRLKNKHDLIFMPYQEPKSPNPGLIYYTIMPDSYFEMTYNTEAKEIMLYCKKLSLVIEHRLDEYSSILDYNNSKVLLEFKTPSVRDNPNCLLNLDSSAINFQINFCNKKSTKSYSAQPVNFYGHDIWPEYFIDTLKLR